MMRLRFLHITGLTPYARASSYQSHFVRTHLDYKALPQRARCDTPSPEPVLFTFQTPPTYTCGRREIGTLSPSQIAYLQNDGKAEFYEALRGGLTTFHGPGQLTAYLILSIDSHQLSPKSYVKLLEAAVIDTCSCFGIKAFTTENPGVWTTADNKLASLGVHLRRYVTSHGIGLNVSVDLSWFDRIVACGLVGKRATSFENEGVIEFGLETVASALAESIAKKLPGVSHAEQLSFDDAITNWKI